MKPFTSPWLLISLLVLAFGAGCAGTTQDARPAPPDLQLLAEVDLSSQSFANESLGQFTLDETAVVTIVYSLPNIDTTYFALHLIGPAEESRLILQSEQYRTDESGGGSWEQTLLPGTYRLALTADQSPGRLSVSWGHR